MVDFFNFVNKKALIYSCLNFHLPSRNGRRRNKKNTCMKKIQWLILSVVGLFMFQQSTLLAQSLITFTETYTGGVNPTTVQKTHWTNFKAQLTSHCYTQVHLYGTYNPSGFTVTNPADVATIANNINTGTTFQIASGGNNWQYCSDDLRINGPVVSYCSSCNNGDCLRPMNGYAGNWGGLNGATCGAGTQTITLEFTFNGTGTCGNISGSADVCQGQSGVNFSVPAVSGASTYTWTLPSGAVIASGNGTNSITVDFDLAAVSGVISVYASGSCGTGSASPDFNINVSSGIPSVPLSISGNASVCNGSSQTYSIGNVSGATNYTWTLPSGWIGSSTTSTINASVVNSAGSISVSANNSCGNSASQTLAVGVIQAPSQPGSISGNANVCAGSAQTYSITSIPDATDYTWTLPLGWTGSSTSNTINTIAGNVGGIISVSANNSCGSSLLQTLAVTANTIDTSVTTTASSLMSNAAGANYQWVTCPLFQAISGATAQTYYPTQNGNYAVIVTQNTCTDTSHCFQIIITDVTNEPKDKNISIYPNPTDGLLNITLNNLAGEQISILVANTLGQKLIDKRIYTIANPRCIEINLSGFEKGVYILVIQSMQATHVYKIQKIE
jgi:hypothetical protein